MRQFCRIKGHFAAVCLKRQASVQEVAPVRDADSGTAIVLSVQAAPTSPRDLRIPVVVGGQIHISLLEDTGATASLMTKTDFDALFASKHRLLQTSVHMQNFSKQRIPILGCFHTDLQHRVKQAHVTFYVTTYGTSLLGRDAIQKLRLLIDGATLTCRRASPVSSQLPAGVPPGFQHLFDGELGLVRDYIHRVKRRPDVPVSAKLRRLPLALRQQVASELRWLQDDDVIVDGRGRRPHSKAQISSAQSFSPESDANGSSASAHGSCNQPSSGRDGDRSSKSAPDSRNSQSLPAGPGSRRPQRTRKPPALLKDYITD
ncbi:hypothetical protein HPB52_021017 [Rhipicephalus sanguineus]|uniref:Peptidase A2 domain-containing protein n=1 Tax=Rhipicephalus sanguineus TaxID=34632 RepID=A0A9D4T4M9_RHISA|nr:hypothetical protein HPB52_021017 [Rhipicephalus sanguineus]